MKTEKLLRVEDAAELLGLRVSTIRKMVFERRIPTVKIGRSIRVPIEAVNRIISDGWRDPVVAGR